MRTVLLLTVLLSGMAFLAGEAFNQWLHRPIRLEAPDLMKTERCYSDRAEACPPAPRDIAPRATERHLRPIVADDCRFLMFGFNACQKIV